MLTCKRGKKTQIKIDATVNVLDFVFGFIYLINLCAT